MSAANLGEVADTYHDAAQRAQVELWCHVLYCLHCFGRYSPNCVDAVELNVNARDLNRTAHDLVVLNSGR